MNARCGPSILRTAMTVILAVTITGCPSRGAPSATQPAGQPGATAPAPTSTQPAAPPGEAPPVAPAAPGPLQGPLQPETPYTVGAAGRNTNVQLAVSDLRLMAAIAGTTAPPGFQYVVLATVWRKTETVVSETPYVVPELADHLYLLVDGRHVLEVSATTEQLPDHVPYPSLVVEKHGQEVRGAVAFAVPAGALRSLTLQFYDFDHGHITLPLYGTAPAIQDRPAAGPSRNQFLDAAVYRTELTRSLGQAVAPAGSRYLVVDFGAASVVTGAATQLDLDQYAYLIEDGVYYYRVLTEPAGVPHLMHGVVRFIPGFVRRGTLAFLVPEQPGRLELLLDASMMVPLAFVLTPAVEARAQPRPARTITDGDVAQVLINSATAAARVGNHAPAAARRFVVLDITIVNRQTPQGLVVQLEQFVLLDGGTEIQASGATERLPHPMTAERVVPGGRRARFEIAFEVPQGSTPRLRYQGFTKIEEVPLP